MNPVIATACRNAARPSTIPHAPVSVALIILSANIFRDLAPRRNITTCAFFVGRLSQQPKVFGNGAKITIATNHSYKNERGEWKELTRYVPIAILREPLAAKVKETAKVGDAVVIKWSAEPSSYTNAAGEKIWELQLVAHSFTNYGSQPDITRP